MSLAFYASYVALWALVVFETLVVIGLVKAHGRGAAQRAPESESSAELAPTFQAVDLVGDPIGSSSLRGDRAALLFVAPDCPACAASPVQVEALAAKTGAPVVVVCGGDADQCAALAADFPGDVRVIADERHAIGDLFRITATPTAITLTADGRIASRGYAMSSSNGAQPDAASVPEIVVTTKAGMVGRGVPAFAATDVHDAPFASGDIAGERTSLLFTSPDCTSCEVLREELELLLEREPGQFVVVCESGAERCTSMEHYYDHRVRVVPDPDHVLQDLFQVTSLPTLVSVGESGRIDAVGAPTSAATDGVESVDHRLQQVVNEMRG